MKEWLAQRGDHGIVAINQTFWNSRKISLRFTQPFFPGWVYQTLWQACKPRSYKPNLLKQPAARYHCASLSPSPLEGWVSIYKALWHVWKLWKQACKPRGYAGPKLWPSTNKRRGRVKIPCERRWIRDIKGLVIDIDSEHNIDVWLTEFKKKYQKLSDTQWLMWLMVNKWHKNSSDRGWIRDIKIPALWRTIVTN